MDGPSESLPQATDSTLQPDFRERLANIYPNLYKFAFSLTKNSDEAKELAQQTCYLALENQRQFKEGTNLTAWALTIAPKPFRDAHRHLSRSPISRRQQAERAFAETASSSNQESILQLHQTLEQMKNLPVDQQRALTLIALGHDYEEAAAELGVDVGTVKSRVSRARAKLERMVDGENSKES